MESGLTEISFGFDQKEVKEIFFTQIIMYSAFIIQYGKENGHNLSYISFQTNLWKITFSLAIMKCSHTKLVVLFMQHQQ